MIVIYLKLYLVIYIDENVTLFIPSKDEILV